MLHSKTMNEILDITPFQALFEFSSVGIIISNSAGDIERLNPFAAKIFGYTPEELLGKKIEFLLPEQLKNKHCAHRQAYMSDPKLRAMGQGLELEARKKDNTKCFIEVSLSYYKINDQLQIVSFVNDIAERKKIKEELKRQAYELEGKVNERTRELSQALLELNHTNQNLEIEIKQREKIDLQMRHALEKEKELSELKSKFVSMASHEFRTPLGGILTSASLLQKYSAPEDEPKRAKHIKTIKKSVKILTSILNDFLSLDKLDQGKICAHPTPFQLSDFIKNVIEETQEVIEITEESHDIRYLHAGNDFKLYQDSGMLRNILINLLSNAMKYSSPDKPVTLETERNGENLKLTVRDEGLGIPEADQKNLFERFFRASNVTNIQGTGLGLSIIKRYLEYMGGQIEFKSQENVGTTFTLRIPVEVKQDEKNPTYRR